ncbi:MAG: alpha-galactosidase [Anaerolineaceae bacterium]|nr:alpha-galactosidase [Anaerolineaceae bacterium]
MIKTTSPDLVLSIDPENQAYSLTGKNENSPSLNNAKFNVAFHQSKKKVFTSLELIQDTQSVEFRSEITRFGDAKWINLSYKTGAPEVFLEVTFALLLDRPLSLIKMTLINQSEHPLSVDKFTACQSDNGAVTLSDDMVGELAFYSNGWQSWSNTSVYGAKDIQHRSHLGLFQQPMVINKGTPLSRKAGHFSSDMFAVLGDRKSRKGLLTGYLSQKQHFGSITAVLVEKPNLEVWANGDGAILNPGDQISTDWTAITFVDIDQEDPLKNYLDAVIIENQIPAPKDAPVGWCSWYYFYSKVTADDIRANLDTIVDLQNELPLSLVQIDDGFEKNIGDWLEFNEKFPDGLKPLADEIKAEGLTPGIWLAPYIVHPKADIIKTHPDWILRNKFGRRVNAGFVWNSLTTALDITHPDALAYTNKVIAESVEQWGFPYLKLDFLYAAALGGKYHDPTKTRAQVLRMGLESIRETVGEKVTLLACGCPLGSALGLFDIMRVSADVSGSWKPEFGGISKLFIKEPHMPCAKNAINNILSRAFLDKCWWGNDPDCLLIRPDSKLTLAEVQSLATVIAITGGSMLLSDDLPALPENRLAIAKLLIPVIKERAIILDWFDKGMPEKIRVDFNGPAGSWHLLTFFNWSDSAKDQVINFAEWGLDSGPFIGMEQWTSQIFVSDKAFIFNTVPAHGVRIIAIRKYDAEEPIYLGSNLHISQGMEVSGWQVNQKGLEISFELPRKAKGTVYLGLPKHPKSVTQDNEILEFKQIDKNQYSIDLEFFKKTKIIINY